MKTHLSDQQGIAEAVLAAMPACVYVYDLADNRSIFQNRPFASLLGYGDQDIAHLRDGEWRRFIHPEDAERFPAHRERMRAMRAGDSVHFEYRMRHANGSWRWILSRDQPLTVDASGAAKLVVGTATDITEQKHTEERLRESDARQKFLLEFGDRLRVIANAHDVMSEATAMLGQHLGASGATYGQVDDAVEFLDVERDWTDGKAPSVAGRHPLIAYGVQAIDELKAGRVLLLEDTQSDPRTMVREIARAYEAVSVRAAIVVPLIKAGKLAAALVVTSAVPRRWHESEVTLVRDVAERTWAAVERARAEEAVRHNNAELQTILDAVPAAIWVTHDRDARNIEGNRASYEMLRLDEGENLSKTADAAEERPAHFHVLDGEGRELAPDDLPVQRAARGEEVRGFEERVVFDDGDFVDLLGDAVPLRDDIGRITGAVATFVDVTALKRTRDALRLSEERFQLAVEGAGAGVWDHDLVTRSFSWSARHFAMLGYEPESFAPTFDSWRERVHRDDLDAAMEEFAAAKAARRAFRAVYRINRADTAEERWIEDSGRYFYNAAGHAVRCAGVILDATDRVRAAQALGESEQRFRNMADHAPVMVWTSDASGSRTYNSRSWYEFTGQTEEQGLAFGWLDAIHPEERERVGGQDREGHASHAPFRMEYRLRRDDGEHRWMLDVAAPRLDSKGEFHGFIGSIIDITERKRAEDHIRTLLGEVNHRSKNLLAVVQAISHQTAKGGESAKDFERRFSARLRALAASQDLLTKRMWTGVLLDELIFSQVDTELAGARLFIDVDVGVLLSPPAAQSIGMALHELSVNAIKHGALSNPIGTVTIAAKIEHAENDEPYLNLSWIESGGPITYPPARKGFGHVVTSQALAAQLRADVDLDYALEGVRWRLRVPLVNILAADTGPYFSPKKRRAAE